MENPLNKIPMLQRTPEQFAKARFAMCVACPHKRTIGRALQCKKCGCMMNIKTHLKGAKCPVGHWGPVTITRQESEQALGEIPNANEKEVNPNG